MAALISGSIAFDTITVFHGRFSQQILPDQLHILNVSFLVPEMRREYGGCAGNMAYTLQQLGAQAVVVGSVGRDGQDYVQRMRDLGIDTSLVTLSQTDFTAQAMIMTDEANNQITGFHPGAMQHAKDIAIPARDDLRIGLVGPNDKLAMTRHARQLHAAGVPFIFDPGQCLPLFDGPELLEMVDLSTWVACNDYEARMMCERTQLDLAALSRRAKVQTVIVTLADQGCEYWRAGQRAWVPGVPARQVLDPTGCGDAFRAGLLYGLERNWDMERCIHLANHIGAEKIAHQGGQNHSLSDQIRALLV